MKCLSQVKKRKTEKKNNDERKVEKKLKEKKEEKSTRIITVPLEREKKNFKNMTKKKKA